jgi:hypothetical protein
MLFAEQGGASDSSCHWFQRSAKHLLKEQRPPAASKDRRVSFDLLGKKSNKIGRWKMVDEQKMLLRHQYAV